MSGSGGGYVHATALVIGETGLLLEGISGSGKSSLAAALLTDAVLFGCFGRLVGDDRIQLRATHGRLIARPHPTLAGLLERRGVGLVRVDHEAACVVGLVVSLATDHETRLPDQPPTREVQGIELPRLALRSTDAAGENSRRIFQALTLKQLAALV